MMQNYKAICLHQPWASLMAARIKKNETRGYDTKWRGELIICATLARPLIENLPSALVDIVQNNVDTLGLRHVKWKNEQELFDALPRGKALCRLEILATLKTTAENVRELNQTEFHCGDYSPGRFFWLTDSVKKFEPLPVKGSQGFFFLSPEQTHEINRRIKLA